MCLRVLSKGSLILSGLVLWPLTWGACSNAQSPSGFPNLFLIPNLNLLWLSFMLFSQLLSLVTRVKRPVPALSLPLMQMLKTTMRSHLSLLQAEQTKWLQSPLTMEVHFSFSFGIHEMSGRNTRITHYYPSMRFTTQCFILSLALGIEWHTFCLWLWVLQAYLYSKMKLMKFHVGRKTPNKQVTFSCQHKGTNIYYSNTTRLHWMSCG